MNETKEKADLKTNILSYPNGSKLALLNSTKESGPRNE